MNKFIYALITPLSPFFLSNVKMSPVKKTYMRMICSLSLRKCSWHWFKVKLPAIHKNKWPGMSSGGFWYEKASLEFGVLWFRINHFKEKEYERDNYYTFTLTYMWKSFYVDCGCFLLQYHHQKHYKIMSWYKTPAHSHIKYDNGSEPSLNHWMKNIIAFIWCQKPLEFHDHASVIK